MKVVENRFLGMRSLQAWFAEDPHEVEALLPRAPIITAMQCAPDVADALARWTVRRRAFHTILVDLRKDEAALWDALERKTCRYQINKAKKLGAEVVLNERLDEAYALFDGFFRRHPFRPPLGHEEWRRITECCDVFVALHEGRAVAAHVILAEAPMCARALMSATADRAEAGERAVAGALNRWLHWHEFCHYKAQGVRVYDLGGVVKDPALPEWSISQFKSLFGGVETTHEILHLARNPLLRAALRLASRHRGANPSAARPAAEAAHAA